MMRRETWVILSVIVLGLTIALPSAPPIRDEYHGIEKPANPTDPHPRKEASWWTRFKMLHRQVASAPHSVVFLGDSITHGWEYAGKDTWLRHFSHRQAINLGIERDSTENLIWRLQHGHLPVPGSKLFVLLIGTNNAGRDDPEATADAIRRIVTLVRQAAPQAKVLLLGLFPRGTDARDRYRRENQQVNRLIAQFADNKLIFYLDIGQSFLKPDGTFKQGVVRDGVHLTSLGYELWAKAMEPTIQRLMQTP